MAIIRMVLWWLGPVNKAPGSREEIGWARVPGSVRPRDGLLVLLGATTLLSSVPVDQTAAAES